MIKEKELGQKRGMALIPTASNSIHLPIISILNPLLLLSISSPFSSSCSYQLQQRNRMQRLDVGVHMIIKEVRI